MTRPAEPLPARDVKALALAAIGRGYRVTVRPDGTVDLLPPGAQADDQSFDMVDMRR